jgi:hypothetical protein
VSAAIVWRYVEEMAALVSARSPNALRQANRDGPRWLMPDGTPIPTDRIKTDSSRLPADAQDGLYGADRHGVIGWRNVRPLVERDLLCQGPDARSGVLMVVSGDALSFLPNHGGWDGRS